MIENYLDNQEQTMQATLTSRRDHNFRVNNRKENKSYNNKLITLYERKLGFISLFEFGLYSYSRVATVCMPASKTILDPRSDSAIGLVRHNGGAPACFVAGWRRPPHRALG